MTMCLRGNESGSFFYYSTGLKCACGKTQLKDEAMQYLFERSDMKDVSSASSREIIAFFQAEEVCMSWTEDR